MRIVSDFKAFTENKSLAQKIVTLFLNPCFHSVCLFRLSNNLYRCHLELLARCVWYINRLLFHVDIDYRANLAGGFVIIHGLGLVIGKSVISKGRLVVYQHVTLGGGNGKPCRLDPDGIERGMPLIGDGCIIYTGAVVIGGITISDNTLIKANSIVASDI